MCVSSAVEQVLSATQFSQRVAPARRWLLLSATTASINTIAITGTGTFTASAAAISDSIASTTAAAGSIVGDVNMFDICYPLKFLVLINSR